MPGKQVGVGNCYPDRLIGRFRLPTFTPPTTPSEATIAVVRTPLPCLPGPPAENAGLYKGLKELKEPHLVLPGLKRQRSTWTGHCQLDCLYRLHCQSR
jgi:magnesium chelatase subunit H